MKKVLFTSHLANFVKFNNPYIQCFQEQGWEVHYASLNEEEILNCDKHFKVDFNRSPFSFDNVKAYFQLKKIIDDEGYDLIHCHTPMGGVVTRLAALGARKKGTRVIYTAHGFHFYKGAPKVNWILYYTMEKFLARFTDCLVTINSEDYNTAVSKGFRAGSIEKINGVGVDLTRFCPVNLEEKLELRRKNGFDEDDFILIYTAELNENKNQEFLINGIIAMVETIPNIKLLLVGRGARKDYLQNLIRHKNLGGRVMLCGYRRDTELLYRLSDIFVSASIREGLGIAVIEGMACGLPAVISQNRGHIELICNGENGFLFEQGDLATFIASITELYCNPAKYNAMGENATTSVAKFSVIAAREQMMQIYKDTGVF